ncbi:MAG: toprim domain-containing protein [Balneolaceae bacterium]
MTKVKSKDNTKPRKNYSAKDVSYFANDIAKIQAKPTMYIGPLNKQGLFNIVREALDNSLDESRAGRNPYIGFVFDSKKQEAFIIDEGVGIPVEKHPKAKISTLTHIVTALQSSGKIKSDAYKNSGGTHGVGITAANALCSEFEVWTFRKKEGGWHHTKFVEGKEKSPVKKVSSSKLPFKRKSGTIVRMVPNSSFFKKEKLDVNQIHRWAELSSYLNRGIKIGVSIDGSEEKIYHSKEGLPEYVDKKVKEFEAEYFHKKVFTLYSDNVEISIAFTDANGDNIEYYTNSIANIEGGEHQKACVKAFKEAIKTYGNSRMKYSDKDLFDGIVGILNYNIQEPEFDSQTKEKLVDTRVAQACYDTLYEAFREFFMQNRSFTKNWLKRATEIHQRHQGLLKDKKLAAGIKNQKAVLSKKLADVTGKIAPEHCELYLVEGDSAGGSAKKARDIHRQAVFPLKGKPLNVMDAQPEKIINNVEVQTILAAIGVDLSLEVPTSNMPYGKIIIMADADVDGKHINTLLQTVFYKFAPELIEQGRIFVLRGPEYLARYKGKTVFGSSKKSVLKKLGLKSEDKKRAEIRHIKGWGEMNPEDLAIAGMESTRTLYQLQPMGKKEISNFEALMGKKPAYRKKLLGVSTGDTENVE